MLAETALKLKACPGLAMLLLGTETSTLKVNFVKNVMVRAQILCFV